jgi:hypothetical protein
MTEGCPMIYNDVELHGFEEAVPAEGGRGVYLRRVPESVRRLVNPGAQDNFCAPASGEIRFVCDGPARVTLGSPNGNRYCVFHGPFALGDVGRLAAGEETALEIAAASNATTADPATLRDLHFSPNVRRIALRDGQVRFVSVEAESLRPPAPEELPKIRLLTYGTSITHGASATAPHLSYAAQAAWRLRADLINLGVGGSCQCERELADYIAERKDWDVASVALSVNMRGFAADEYTKRLHYFVDRVAGADTSRPVACVTLWPFFDDLGKPFWPAEGMLDPGFMRQALRDAVKAAGHPNLLLLEGPELLTYFGGLSADLIHPGDHAMIEMGENLARRLRDKVSGPR